MPDDKDQIIQSWIRFRSTANLICVLDHSSRAGNFFFLSIFDQHPEVMSCPLLHYTYSYLIDRFGQDSSLGSTDAKAYWTERYYFRNIYNTPTPDQREMIQRFGGDPDFELDRETVRTIFDTVIDSSPTIERRELVLLTYFSLASALRRDLSQIKYCLISDAVSLRSESAVTGFSGQVADEIVKDFPSAVLVSLVRDIRANFASIRQEFLNRAGNMYSVTPGTALSQMRRLLRADFDLNRCCCIYLYCLTYLASAIKTIYRLRARYPERFVIVRNEDLNLSYLPTITSLAEKLAIQVTDLWKDPEFRPTIFGAPWSGGGAYNSRSQQGRSGPLRNDRNEESADTGKPNAFVTRRWRTRLPPSEIKLLELLFHSEIKDQGYEFLQTKPGTAADSLSLLEQLRAVAPPSQGEIPGISWLRKGAASGMGELGRRLFYLLVLPFFYIASRYMLLGFIRRRKFFSSLAGRPKKT